MAERGHRGARHRRCFGPLGPHLDSFTKHLVALGYARKTRGSQLPLVRAFDRWIARHAVSLTDFDEGVVQASFAPHRVVSGGTAGPPSVTCSRTFVPKE